MFLSDILSLFSKKTTYTIFPVYADWLEKEHK